ncbi:LPXTG cell wall anchor domain-containing protein [Streptococcus halichoeri]|uniref:LPXTG cell wall anchor domain-containing protein n=1 Tax=Streptococcus halichoeri TaxID=254785 RepID=UPI001358C8D2|nr:LPXTG cell wall anchor domain-containing protein [Streptococcus halichoeri]
MAKHHWSKKAVLASLMLGASALVGAGARAEEIHIPSDTFKNSFFDLTDLGAKYEYLSKINTSTSQTEMLKIPEELENIISALNSSDLTNLFKGMINDFGPETEENLNATELYKRAAKSGLQNLIATYEIQKPNSPSQRWSTELLPVLLIDEVLRRSKGYEDILNKWRTSDNKAQKVKSNLEEKLINSEQNLTNVALEWKVEKEKTKQLQEKLTKASEDGQKLKAESDKLATQLKSSQEANSDLQTKMKDLETQAQKATEEANALHEQVTEANNTNQNLQAQLDSKQKELNDLQQQLTSDKQFSEEEKAKLQSELDAKKTEVTNLQAQVAESSEKLQALEEAKKEAEAKVNSLTSEKAEIEAKLKDQSQLSEEEKAKLEKQLADIQSKIAEKDASIKSLEGQLDALKQQEHDTAPSTPETPQVPEVKPEDKPKAPSTPEVQPTPETKPQAPQAPEAGKPSTPKKPEIKPAPTPGIPEVKPSKPHTPEKPGKGKSAAPKAHHATTPTTPDTAASSTQNTAAPLPQTGDAATNPFFTVAALSIIASAGVLATKRKED